MNVGHPRHENVVSGSILCQHDRAVPAKSADIWLSGRHVADMSATLPAKCPKRMQQTFCAGSEPQPLALQQYVA